MKNNFLAMEENFLQLQVIFYPFPKQIWAFKHGTNISVQDNFDFVQDNFDFVQDNFDFVRDKNNFVRTEGWGIRVDGHSNVYVCQRGIGGWSKKG